LYQELLERLEEVIDDGAIGQRLPHWLDLHQHAEGLDDLEYERSRLGDALELLYIVACEGCPEVLMEHPKLRRAKADVKDLRDTGQQPLPLARLNQLLSLPFIR